MSSRTPSARPELHLITESTVARSRLIEVVNVAVRSGVDVVHVRDRSMAARPLLDLVTEIQTAVDRRARVIVNDRLDVALAAACDGVQLASHSLPANSVRRLVGEALAIGVSVHSPDEAQTASVDGADFAVFGHVYASTSHAGVPARGLDDLREVVLSSSIPIIAIGGIHPDRVSDVLAAGARGVAVLSSIFQATDPGEAARLLRGALDAWSGIQERK